MQKASEDALLETTVVSLPLLFLCTSDSITGLDKKTGNTRKSGGQIQAFESQDASNRAQEIRTEVLSK